MKMCGVIEVKGQTNKMTSMQSVIREKRTWWPIFRKIDMNHYP